MERRSMCDMTGEGSRRRQHESESVHGYVELPVQYHTRSVLIHAPIVELLPEIVVRRRHTARPPDTTAGSSSHHTFIF